MKKLSALFVACLILIVGCGAPMDDLGLQTLETAEDFSHVEEDSSPVEDAWDLDILLSESLSDAEYAMEPRMTPGSVEQIFIDHIPNSEEYLTINENTRVFTSHEPTLTFSLKIDTASYRNTLRHINSGNLPPADAVRTEEFINYFTYDQQMPEPDGPFSIHTEIGQSIFNSNNHMAFIRVRSRDIDRADLPPSNLTFLIDTSGSMSPHNRLPLLQSAFGLLVETLTENDVVSIVTYASGSGVVLDSVRGDRKDEIMYAINILRAGGSTAGADGIQTAYALAEKNYMPNANNRIILATDGDFNVGVASISELEDLISNKRQTGIYLSILGVGMGNLRDSVMETLAKHGNGNYHYIDNLSEARKVLVDEATANLFTIADDVKAQVEFNPDLVSSYRLIGYENRALRNEDFEDDQVLASAIGIGTDVVVMFELELNDDIADSPVGELFDVRIRYKDPGDTVCRLITHPVREDRILESNSADFNFASAVAAFAHILRGSDFTGEANINTVITQARANLGVDEFGHRKEFVEMALRSRGLLD